MDKQKDIPEAVASVTYSITSKDGYNALFTIRGTSGADLLDTMETIEKVIADKGYKPQVKPVFGAKKEIQYVDGKVCPLCKGRLIKAVSKAGKEFHKCENGKWNPLTKQAEGCTFVDWMNPVVPAYNKQDPYSGGGINAEEFGA